MLTLDVSMKNPLSRQSLVVLIFPILGDFLICMETSENRVMIISALTKHECKLILLDFYQVHEEFVVGEITRKMGGAFTRSALRRDFELGLLSKVIGFRLCIALAC
jgi:hypothetical protein